MHQRVVLDLNDGVAGARHANIRLVTIVFEVARLVIDFFLRNILHFHSQAVPRLLRRLEVFIDGLIHHVILHYLLAAHFQRLQLVLYLALQVLFFFVFELVVKEKFELVILGL